MGRVVVPLEGITQELVKHVFDYEDGYLLWKNPKSKIVTIGDKVGHLRKDGYWVTNVFGKLYLIHRLIWFWHHNSWPELIDHIDQNPSNNKIENLRVLDKSGDAYNTNRLWSHNASGVRGVSWDTRNSKWVVRFKQDGKYKFLGYFSDKDQAIKTRKQAERSLGQ